MTHHEPESDIFDDMLREAVESNLAEQDNRDAIHRDFDRLCDIAVGSGHVTVTGSELKRMTRDYHWTRLNNKASRATQNYLKDLVRGDVKLFELESVLDSVVTAGKSRRTTIRHMTERDLDRMTEEREQNYQKQTAAINDWRANVDPSIRRWLQVYGGIPAAAAAGAIELDGGDEVASW